MLPSLSGSSVFLRTYCFEVNDESIIGEARRLAADLTYQLEFDDVRASRVAIIISEYCTNLARHAKKGRLLLRAALQFGERYVEIISVDGGPGLDVSSFRDGVTSGTTPGTGLGAIRRQSDVFDYETNAAGTILVSEVHATDESAQLSRTAKMRISAICLPINGENVVGDSWASRATLNGFEILGVDGLGHGELAHSAAKAAVNCYYGMGLETPLESKLQLIHGALRATRGAAVSIALFTPAAAGSGVNVAYTGIGNIRAVICEPARDRTLLTHPGTAGLQYRPRPVNHTSWSTNGLFVMHSDGLQSRWESSKYASELNRHPALLAASLLRDYSRGTDDVTVIVARYGGSA